MDVLRSRMPLLDEEEGYELSAGKDHFEDVHLLLQSLKKRNAAYFCCCTRKAFLTTKWLS